MSLVLALVMCVGLTVPAFAVPAVRPEIETVESSGADVPQYAVNQVPYTIDLQNNTYASIIFWIAQKGGTVSFEDRVSVSFYNTNPKGSHWEVMDWNYAITGDKFKLFVTVIDVEGVVVSSLIEYQLAYTVYSWEVSSPVQSAEDGNGIQAPDSVSVRWYPEEIKNNLPAGDGGAVFLIPDSVSVWYIGEAKDVRSQNLGYYNDK